MNKIKFAVVGAGHIGKRHAAMIKAHPEAELLGIADNNKSLESELGQLFEVPFFSSLEALLDAVRPDVVCVCTPNFLHAKHTIAALNSGAHVVCEKPMALTSKDCEAMIAVADKVGKNIFCVMQNRYSPPSEWLKGIIENNLLGQMFFVQINCFWNRDERYYKGSTWKGVKEKDGGVIFTQFSHFVDTLYWLLGEVYEINSVFENLNHAYLNMEDSGIVTFKLKEGGLGTLNFTTCTWDTNFESSITIIGEKGTVKVGGQYMNKVEYCHIKDYQMTDLKECGPANDYGSYKGSAANHHLVIENVINSLKGKADVKTASSEGRAVVKLIEQMYQNQSSFD